MARRKYRWILFEVICSEDIEKNTLTKSLRKKAYELFGTFGCPEFHIVRFDSERKIGIIRCIRNDINKLRVVLAFMRSLDSGTPMFINDLYCSGTLRALLEKARNIKGFQEKLSSLVSLDE